MRLFTKYLSIFQLGYVPYIPMSIMDMVGSSDAGQIMHYIFCFLIPPYNIFGGFYFIDKVCTTITCKQEPLFM